MNNILGEKETADIRTGFDKHRINSSYNCNYIKSLSIKHVSLFEAN